MPIHGAICPCSIGPHTKWLAKHPNFQEAHLNG